MNRSRHPRQQPRRRAFVLIAVLVVVVLLSLASYQFAELMTAEYRTAVSGMQAAQAHSLAEGGIDYVLATVTNPALLGQQVEAQASTTTSGQQAPWQPPNLINNTSLFQGVAVDTSNTTGPQGRFSIIAPIGPDEVGNNAQPFHFGVTDEGGKINLNAIMQLDPSGQTLHDMLMQLQTQLPNLTEDVINSIIDWIDTDSTPRTNGAEDDYYSSQTPSYHCKNGPLDSLAEMLLIKGMTPQLLLGNDRNRNGTLDAGEDDGSGQVSFGLSAYVTVYSRELNVSSNGQPRIYVNAGDLNQLQNDLTSAVGEDLANYIVAYRQYGPAQSASMTATLSFGGSTSKGGQVTVTLTAPPPASGSSGSSRGSSGSGGASGGSGGSGGGGGGGSGGGGGGGNTRIRSLYELIGSSVSIPSSTPGGQPSTLQSPLNDASQQAQLLPLLLDTCTTVNSPELPARINVNTAPAAVIYALPGIQQTDAENILANRPDPNSTDPVDPIYQTTAWLVTQASLSPRTLQSLEKYITASSQVYRVQSIGYFDQGGPTARIEAVIDTNAGMPRILFWHDLTDLGPGFDLQAVAGQ